MFEYNSEELLNFMNSAMVYNEQDETEVPTELVPVYTVIRRNTKVPEELKDDQALKFGVVVQKAIGVITKGDLYSHAAVWFDIDYPSMFSFSPEEPPNGGIIIEYLDQRSTWTTADTLYVNVLFVTPEAKELMKSFVTNLCKNRSETSYAMSNFVSQYVTTPAKSDKRFICSTFVGYVLAMSDPKNLHRDYSRLRPEDITVLPRAFYIGNYEGSAKLLNDVASIKSLTKSIYDNHREELLDYNNHLPKLMVKNQVTKMKAFDKFVDKVSKHESLEYNPDELLQLMESVSESSNNDLVPIYMILRSNYKVLDKRADGEEYSSYDKGAADFGKKINDMSGDHYSHVTLSFDDTFENMYSFENNHGIVTDNINTNSVWLTTSNIYITVMFVEKDAFAKMYDYTKDLYAHRDETNYDLSNMVKGTLGIKVNKTDKRFVCSTFVGYVLAMSDPKNIHRDYAHLRPEDYTVLPRSFYIGSYPNALELKNNLGSIKSLTKSIYDNHREELLDYNNHLPKLMLKNQFSTLKTSDKIIDWALKRIEN